MRYLSCYGDRLGRAASAGVWRSPMPLHMRSDVGCDLRLSAPLSARQLPIEEHESAPRRPPFPPLICSGLGHRVQRRDAIFLSGCEDALQTRGAASSTDLHIGLISQPQTVFARVIAGRRRGFAVDEGPPRCVYRRISPSCSLSQFRDRRAAIHDWDRSKTERSRGHRSLTTLANNTS